MFAAASRRKYRLGKRNVEEMSTSSKRKNRRLLHYDISSIEEEEEIIGVINQALKMKKKNVTST